MKKSLVRIFRVLIFFVISLTFTVTAGLARDSPQLRKASGLLAKGEYELARTLYMAEAENGNPIALFTLGLFELNGWGRSQDNHAACTWFHKAATLDVPMANLYMGDCLVERHLTNVEQRLPQYWYQRAVDLGLPQGWCLLGKLHLKKGSESSDLEKAIELCEKGAEQGVLSSQLAVAELIVELETAHRDLQKAKYWLEQAAMGGDKVAQFKLAEFMVASSEDDKYLEGILQLYQQAALQGYQPAYGPTGQMNYELGVKRDDQEEPAKALGRAYFWLLLLQESSDGAIQTKYLKTLNILENTLDSELKEHISHDVANQRKFIEGQ